MLDVPLGGGRRAMVIPGIFVVGGAATAAFAVLSAFGFSLQRKQVSARLRRTESELQAARDTIHDKDITIDQGEAALNLAGQKSDELVRLLKEKSGALPWISKLVADLHWAQDERAVLLLTSKKHPAFKAAEVVRAHAQEKRQLRVDKRMVEYRIALMESLSPWLADVGFSDAEQVAEAKLREATVDGDPVAQWLSSDEWAKLSVSERNQRALDRYKKRAKTDWEIGRDFERFIGYHWEKGGYDVIYYGAIKGFDDFGRDLIVTGKTGKIAVIQCKYWAKRKTIPEAAVFQLLGSTVAYYIEQNGRVPSDLGSLYQAVQPYLYSSAPLAPRIRDIAVAMGIKVRDDMVMTDWPMVKCNVAADAERIYHLPMDQQYDRVKIAHPGECYVATVAEAEGKGFRRAKRWIGPEAT